MAKNVTLDWTDPSPTTYVNQLEIWRKVDGGTYAHIGGAQLGDETYDDDSGVTDSTKYYYEVRAYNIDRNYSVVENNITITTGTGYLLDTYTGAAAAYSLRKLRAVETSAIKVRRSSDNATTDILLETSGSITLSSFITGGSITFSTWVGSNSAYVETWYDQSGNSVDLTQLAKADQSRIVNAGTLDVKGSLSTLEFDGSHSEYELGSGLSAIAHGNSFSTFSVASNNSTESSGTIFTSAGDEQDRLVSFRDSRTSINRNMYIKETGVNHNYDLSAARVNTNQVLQSFFTNGTLRSAFDNGSAGGTDSLISGTYHNDNFRIGTQLSGMTYMNGQIQELIIFSSDKTSNRTAIESNINTHYSIY